MSSGWDALRASLWAKLIEIDSRRTVYVGQIVSAVASNPAVAGGQPGRVLVSGIDPDKPVLVHPSMTLDDQVRALGNAAVGRDVLVWVAGGQRYGVSIQLTGETRW